MDYQALMRAHEENLDRFEKDTGLIGPNREVPSEDKHKDQNDPLFRQGAWNVWVMWQKDKS